MINNSMKIVSIGVDIALCRRIRRLTRFSDKTVSKILLPSERRIYRKSRDKVFALGRFFSSKEAVFKSLGLTTFGPVGFRWVEIHFGEGKDPAQHRVTLHGPLRQKSRNRISHIFLSSEKIGRHMISQAISMKLS